MCSASPPPPGSVTGDRLGQSVDFSRWSNSYINSNVQALFLITTVLIAAALGLAGALRNNRKDQN